MFSSKVIQVHDETSWESLLKPWAENLIFPICVYLEGELGAGKTTMTRTFLRLLGFKGQVKSPTYTLIEEYTFPHYVFYHLDLYRLLDPLEVENLALRDLLDKHSIIFIEWPEKGKQHIPPADLVFRLEVLDTHTRRLTIETYSKTGEAILQAFDEKDFKK